MDKVLILTFGYNAEKTIARTIESVLNQTHKNFSYVCIDNGSEDNTGKIIREYAIKDERIIPVYHKVNAISDMFIFCLLPSLWSIKQGEFTYFCNLDADDEFTPDFLEETMKFLISNNLDFVACRSDFIDAETYEDLNRFTLNEDIVVTCKSDFSKRLKDYYRYIRTFWGILFKMELISEAFFRTPDLKKNFTIKIGTQLKPRYGKENITAFKILNTSGSFGVLAKTLHKYYVRKNSVTYTFVDSRSRADILRLIAFKQFLLDKCGFISEENIIFIYTAYMKEIADSSNLIINCYNLTNEEKEKHLLKILNNGETYLALNNSKFPEELKHRYIDVLKQGGFGHLLSQSMS